MDDKVKKLDVVDATGIRKNISDLSEEVRKNNISDVVVIYQKKDDEFASFYWNGDRAHVFLLLSILRSEILSMYGEGEYIEHEVLE